MFDQSTYEKQVYAGLLGKVIGVYLGRPFEQWHKDKIVDKWGCVDKYVHEDLDLPLVVADDDISGTLTFIRILEDSGFYTSTPDHLYGENWLNYIMENRTILWWGGNGMSTEHSAYLNLKKGIQAPESGSWKQNGLPVAEQIGAQIFIDGFGLVTPGDPDLAVQLAKKASAVSHDGEAIHAACVVAAMVSSAFVEKDMSKLLDIGISYIPNDSMIAQVHRDVRQWCKEDTDWQATYLRIESTYGYACFGGSCHVVPNHALMVMAWCNAPNDFYEAQKIINTAGYDTDCNAANVGTVMGLIVGLDRINEKYDFQAPFADRLILPTAEGTYSVTDVLTQAMKLSQIGKKIMSWEGSSINHDGHIHHFNMPGALHGYQIEHECKSPEVNITVGNEVYDQSNTSRALTINILNLKKDDTVRISTPILPSGKGSVYGEAKQIQAVPRLFSGMRVVVHGFFHDAGTGQPAIRIFMRSYLSNLALFTGSPTALKPGQYFTAQMQVPAEAWPVKDLGIMIDCLKEGNGKIQIASVDYEGSPHGTFPDVPHLGPCNEPIGWLNDVDRILIGGFPADLHPMVRIGRDQGAGVMVTGNRDWTDYVWSAKIIIHLAHRAGLIVRYQGLRRYVGLLKTKGTIQLIRQYNGMTILHEVPMVWSPDEEHELRIVCSGQQISIWIDAIFFFEIEEIELLSGGAGYFIEEGLAGFRKTTIESR